MQREEVDGGGDRRPVDEDEGEGASAVGVRELVREHDVTRAVLGEFCAVRLSGVIGEDGERDRAHPRRGRRGRWRRRSRPPPCTASAC
jgi:hypothetical protein